ncbi:S-adenosyl-L-methionine-dependent methyltransferase [Lojkania enalia]|uniref:S-adenosyl-L-methionine-dependent methyltransferase n=1 Tax=Lojkania enalia TaxID=147567 RepID=A0A9P4MWK4_9PLEO|nr:S-adenosyl-L-methionine-dependent methyltransferase [Didymosphaeria enalia]
MSETPSQSDSILTEKTFSSYNSEQGRNYARIRRDYHPSLYQAIMDYHGSTGGRYDIYVDVGCGPGFATFNLASHFAHAFGLDPSEGMISTARSFGGTTSTSETIRFEISTAEQLGQNLSPPIKDSSVDLITAANAAHWFNMPRFWISAARALKPSGTVALWTSGEIIVHPSTPNSTAIQKAVYQCQDRFLLPFYETGNLLTRNRYSELPLPWTLAEPVQEFDEKSFIRKDWDFDEKFFVGETEVDLDTWEHMMATSSPYTRWCQANSQLVGTKQDVLKMLRKEIEQLLHEAGVELGEEKVKGTVRGSLLMVKKKA